MNRYSLIKLIHKLNESRFVIHKLYPFTNWICFYFGVDSFHFALNCELQILNLFHFFSTVHKISPVELENRIKSRSHNWMIQFQWIVICKSIHLSKSFFFFCKLFPLWCKLTLKLVLWNFAHKGFPDALSSLSFIECFIEYHEKCSHASNNHSENPNTWLEMSLWKLNTVQPL